LEIFKHDIHTEFNHFPRLLKQNKGKKVTTYVQFIEMITNFYKRFGDILFRKQFLWFLRITFFVTDIIELSAEENDTWNWVDTAELKIKNCNPHFET